MQQIDTIQNNVERVLADRGLGREGKEPVVSQMLHHLCVAIDIYRYMTQEEKNKAGYWFRVFKSSYTLRNFLKERKRNRDKEKSPLHPSYKEIETEIKEKAQKTNERAKRDFSETLEARREAFRQECYEYSGQYDSQQVADFFHYWAEESQKTGKMLFEMEKSWNTKFRLARWNNNQYTSATTAAAIRLEKTKGKAVERQEQVEEEKMVAAERERANAEREAATEQSKAGAVSFEEWKRLRGKG